MDGAELVPFRISPKAFNSNNIKAGFIYTFLKLPHIYLDFLKITELFI